MNPPWKLWFASENASFWRDLEHSWRARGDTRRATIASIMHDFYREECLDFAG